VFYLQTLLEFIELAGGGEGLLHVGAHGKHHQVGHHQARVAEGRVWGGPEVRSGPTAQAGRRPEETWTPVDPPDLTDDYLVVELRPGGPGASPIPVQPPGEERPQPQQEEQEEPLHPQLEEQAHPQQEGRERPQEREEPEQPEEQEEERRLREQEEGRVRVRELVRATIGGRREQERQRQRVRATIDWGMGRERQRADELRRRVSLKGRSPRLPRSPGRS
jgi:hypothetical protein